MPPLHIACSGIGPQASKEEWLKLAQKSGRPLNAVSRQPILDGLENLHTLFSDAPTLGSLIDPNQLPADLITADYETLKPYLDAALTAEQADDDAHERAVAAAGMVKAAELLASEYTLVVTNVPYLGRGKQDDRLKEHLEKHYPEGEADLATAFVLRCLDLCAQGGTAAMVTPQNWLFLTTYKKLREGLLKDRTWNIVARLGPRAFETIGGEVVNMALLALSAAKPAAASTMAGVDVSEAMTTTEKAVRLAIQDPTLMQVVGQAIQLRNPDAILQFCNVHDIDLLGMYADTWQGIVTCDDNRFLCCFWEVYQNGDVWAITQQPPQATLPHTGKSTVIRWENDSGSLRHDSSAHNFPPSAALARPGVAVQRMSDMNASLMSGEVFGDHVAPLFPKDPNYLPAIWCFALSGKLREQVRLIDTQVKVAVGSLLKVPFDLAHWQAIAAEKYPNGLPEPHSDDPTQWLFKGDIASSTYPLLVAVARLLGYRWPEQPEASDAVDALADADGIVCLSGLRGEAPASERLLEVLHTAYGNQWSDAILNKVLTDAGCAAGTTLDDWLRNQFFELHCKRFQQRPFIWHIWDGRKDGFAALVNYHKLDRGRLESLAYAYLGDWIVAQKRSDSAGSDLRLAAAEALQEKLKLILAGEDPYDIFVRWKPLAEQAIGWNPDLNDGVRMNIRPFVQADVLRKKPNIKWGKDRGKEPERDKKDFPWFWNGKNFTGERVNDVHLTIAEKQKARQK